MAVGLGVLRLGPREFWAMTPKEIAAAMGALALAAEQAPSREDLEALMERFPDTAETMHG